MKIVNIGGADPNASPEKQARQEARKKTLRLVEAKINEALPVKFTALAADLTKNFMGKN